LFILGSTFLALDKLIEVVGKGARGLKEAQGFIFRLTPIKYFIPCLVVSMDFYLDNSEDEVIVGHHYSAKVSR